MENRYCGRCHMFHDQMTADAGGVIGHVDDGTPIVDIRAVGPYIAIPTEIRNRPVYVQCVIRDRGVSWCERPRPDGELCFGSLEEAVNSYTKGGKVLACAECVDAAIKALTVCRWAGRV